ncbi:putative ribosome biogenesis protein Erb1 [Aureobasidium pullulans]|nr:putative ribosome biogenesis protein Erb1 [Aureobasidium pullulans]THW38014.1 putative ribosome biogenesis protein Erb1 [Aureobasidium pullulans]TIA66341.1 putative ribosome biogenesis protein Erb1 [Aureobasidium pullulans]
MVLATQNRKRKAASREEPALPPREELANGNLEGILSEGDESDDSEEVEFDGEDEDEEDDEDEEEELDSDEIPSEDDEQDIRDQLRNLKTTDSKRSTNAGADEDDEDLKPNYTVTTDANGNERYVYREIDPVYDSDDSDAGDAKNTIGDIPLSFYDSYPHIGYDINGKKIMRPAKGEALDALLDSIELPEGWTGLTDPQTGKPLELSRDELEVLRKLTRNEAPGEGYDPYPDMVEWFSSKTEIMPLSAAPEPKRRFVPSKHEAKRVMKIVRAIKEGRIKPWKEPSEEDQQDDDVQRYDVWADETPRADHAMNMPAPKLPPPGYAESYHPPPEYLPDALERKAWEQADEEDREREYLPTDHSALRRVPGYEKFIKERFERCLDLYLAPRVRRSKLNIDPESLLPKLPSPDDLRPFPTVCATLYRGHQGRVRCVSVSPTGTFIASGGDDGTVRVWELLSGRQLYSVKLSSEEAVNAVKWRPTRDTLIIAAAAGETVYFITPLALCSPEIEQASKDVIDAGFGYAAKPATTNAGAERKIPSSVWSRPESQKLQDQGVLLTCTMRATIKVINWHRRGDYLSTVSPAATSTAVAIHTLTKHLTQHPFRRLKGIAQTCSFHPTKPLFFVATRQSIRLYDLQQQKLDKELKPGARWISSIDVHPGGDNLLVGSYDRRLLWHDMDLAATPYKTLRYHQKAIRSVRYHPNSGQYPLFADASDDGSLQIFHGKVVGDSLENALIVPLKVLKGHKVTGELGVLDVEWHPREPWLPGANALRPSATTMSLNQYMNKKILIITVDGRTLMGTLVSCDQVTNLVLKDTIERVIRPQDDPEESSETPHGLYMIRGDNVVVCGLVDEAMDSSIDWTKVRGEVIGSTKHVSNQTTGHPGRYIKVTITATAQSAAERGRPAPWD